MTAQHPCVVGQLAPRFELEVATPDLQQGRIATDDYRGRWLAILFYPRDFSFVCPTELTGFSAEKDQFDRRDCDLLGISIDTIESHLRWLSTPAENGGVEGLRFPLASDLAGEVCRRYGVWREDSGLSNRGLFLIDPDGKLRYAASYDLSVGRNVEDSLRALDALQAGGLCPANWKRADGVLDVASMLKSGRVLGHYRIMRELGRGAFGQVFEAEDVRLQRKVALKVITKQTPDTELKILTEARAAASISHPNICTVFSADEIDTLPTIVMEFVEGRPLTDAISAGIADIDIPKICQQLASGLSAAHAKGIVHGDMKPANILLRPNNDPVIVDFGLARSLRQARAQVIGGPPSSHIDVDIATRTEKADDPEATRLLTPPSLDKTIDSQSYGEGVSGTPAFMSPEQASGERLSPASDIFSLGLIFTQMLTGVSPMKEMSVIEIINSLQQTSFVSSLVDKIPASSREYFADMLSKNPADRPSADEILTRFERRTSS